MSTNTSTTDRTALASILAPEDLRCGDYVAVLDEIVEVPSWLWCDSPVDTESPQRIRCRAEDGGVPLKVKAICLPFVFVKSAQRQKRTLDVRQYQLVRLDRHYARTVWKELRRQGGSHRTSDA
jgi:hypothetical protein